VLVSLDDRSERIELEAIEQDIERLRAEVVAERSRLLADNARAEAEVEDYARRFVIDRETAHIDYLTYLIADARDRVLLRGATVEYEILCKLHEQDNAPLRELNGKLHEQDNAPLRELNDSRTEVDSLQATVDRNADVLDQKRQVFEDADRRWSRFMERVDVATAYDSVLTPLRFAIEVRQRDLEQVVRRIDRHVLRAPIEGRVTTLLAHAGAGVQAGAPLIAISPIATDRVVAYLPEPMVFSAQIGAPVSVCCLAGADGERREYAGTVLGLSAGVDEAPARYRQVPAYPVWGRGLLVVLSAGAQLIPGEEVTVWFLKGR
jgi:multidrug resistance efflux pump